MNMDTVFSKYLLISRTQNIERLKGNRFVYHLKHYKYNSARCGFGNLDQRKLTYTEAHNAKGAAVACLNCVEPGPEKAGPGRGHRE
jgi:hypothetical protein